MKKPMATRHEGVFRLDENLYRIRLRVVNTKTGRLAEIDRVRRVTLKEAVALRSQWRQELAQQEVARDRQRLGTFARSWLSSRLPLLRPSTALRYAQLLDTIVLPALADFYLDAIEPADVRACVAEWSRAYAPRTVRHALAVLRTVVRDAMGESMLARDPTARVVGPTPQGFGDQNPNLLEPTDLNRLLEAARLHEPQWFPLLALLTMTGVRFGEATALRWEDIDEAAGIIMVRRAQWRGQIGGTKTNSVRSVPLVPDLAEILRQHRLKMIESQHPGLSDGYCFPSAVGKLLQPGALRKPLLRVLKRAGIATKMTPHGLRRSYNNIARRVTSGEVVRSITGHSSAEMTHHYSHVGAVEKADAANRVVRLIRPNRDPGVGEKVGDQESPAKAAGEKAE